MIQCYVYEGSTNRVPGCDGHLVPEDPARAQGPEVGTFVLYHDKYAEAKGWPSDVVVKVIERSYVWSPELHNPNTGFHGYRHYEWSVIERGPDKYRAVVVNDTDLSPLPERFGYRDPQERIMLVYSDPI